MLSDNSKHQGQLSVSLLFADRKQACSQDRSAVAKPLQRILQEVKVSPVVKTKVLQLLRLV